MTRTRRDFLRGCCAGASLAAMARIERLALAAELGQGHVLAPRKSHFVGPARQLIVVFLTGGYSQVDTFDPKPRLATDHGKPLRKGFALASPYRFARCGQVGHEISELFPGLQTVADELCVLRALHTDIVEHFQATLAMHTGSATVPMPSLGAWLSYALGTENPNLPSFVVLAEHLPYAGAQVWDHGFLPPYHQGVRIVPGPEPIPNLQPPPRPATLAELERIMLDDLNERHADARPGDLDLRARAASFETARGMMQAAPEVLDTGGETAATLADYGLEAEDRTSFAWQALVARRLVERGVRVVTLVDTGAGDNWDAHGDMQQHRGKAARVDRPLAALVRDLKQRGLLDTTLVAVCTEFGRTPWSTTAGGKGREHHAEAFSCLLAGAGVRGGTVYGQTDDYGAAIVDQATHVHDYHATILHLMGLDHERLTYRYAGRDFRLTDVAGRVIQEVIL